VANSLIYFSFCCILNNLRGLSGNSGNSFTISSRLSIARNNLINECCINSLVGLIAQGIQEFTERIMCFFNFVIIKRVYCAYQIVIHRLPKRAFGIPTIPNLCFCKARNGSQSRASGAVIFLVKCVAISIKYLA